MSLTVNSLEHARPAALVGAVILALGACTLSACSDGIVALPVAPAAPPPVLAVQVQPHHASLLEGAQQQFHAVVTGGDAGTVVTWSAVGGSITPEGLYTADSVPGVYMVVGEVAGGQDADTAFVTVMSSSTTFQAVVRDEWSHYATDADLKTAYTGTGNPRKIWGSVDWTKVSLVPDPVFGKALRLTFQQQTPFFDLTTNPSGKPGAVMRMLIAFPQTMDAIWVRGRYKFDYDPAVQPYGWIAKSPNDPSPYGGAYKLFFMHWESPYYERGSLVFNNGARLDFQYYVNSLTMTSETVLGGRGGQLNEAGAPEFTNREWYEFVYLHRKTGPTTSESGAWVRQLTTGAGTLQLPGPWRWVRRSHAFDAPIPSAVSVEFGGNKNHGNEFDEWIIWGPYEIVDASRYANPFGVPMN